MSAHEQHESAELSAVDLDAREQELACLEVEACTLQGAFRVAEAGLESVRQETYIQDQLVHLHLLQHPETGKKVQQNGVEDKGLSERQKQRQQQQVLLQQRVTLATAHVRSLQVECQKACKYSEDIQQVR